MTIADLIKVIDITPSMDIDFVDIKTNKIYEFSVLWRSRLNKYEVVKITPLVFHGNACLQIKFFKKGLKNA